MSGSVPGGRADDTRRGAGPPHPTRCPTCGAPRSLWTSDEGTSSFTPAPILRVILDALREAGWDLDGRVYIDPEGNRYGTVEAAVEAQTFREIAAALPPEGT